MPDWRNILVQVVRKASEGGDLGPAISAARYIHADPEAPMCGASRLLADAGLEYEERSRVLTESFLPEPEPEPEVEPALS